MVRQLLKKGKGIQRIPMAGLKELEKAGTKFSRATGKTLGKELGKIRAEIRKRKR